MMQGELGDVHGASGGRHRNHGDEGNQSSWRGRDEHGGESRGDQHEDSWSGRMRCCRRTSYLSGAFTR